MRPAHCPGCDQERGRARARNRRPLGAARCFEFGAPSQGVWTLNPGAAVAAVAAAVAGAKGRSRTGDGRWSCCRAGMAETPGLQLSPSADCSAVGPGRPLRSPPLTTGCPEAVSVPGPGPARPGCVTLSAGHGVDKVRGPRALLVWSMSRGGGGGGCGQGHPSCPAVSALARSPPLPPCPPPRPPAPHNRFRQGRHHWRHSLSAGLAPPELTDLQIIGTESAFNESIPVTAAAAWIQWIASLVLDSSLLVSFLPRLSLSLTSSFVTVGAGADVGWIQSLRSAMWPDWTQFEAG